MKTPLLNSNGRALIRAWLSEYCDERANEPDMLLSWECAAEDAATRHPTRPIITAFPFETLSGQVETLQLTHGSFDWIEIDPHPHAPIDLGTFPLCTL